MQSERVFVHAPCGVHVCVRAFFACVRACVRVTYP